MGSQCCLARWEPHRWQITPTKGILGSCSSIYPARVFWPFQSHLFCLQEKSLLWPLLRATGTRLKDEICNISDDVSSHFSASLPQTESQYEGSKSILSSMSLKIYCQWPNLLIIPSGVYFPDLLLLPHLSPSANKEGCPSHISNKLDMIQLFSFKNTAEVLALVISHILYVLVSCWVSNFKKKYSEFKNLL